MGGDDRIIFVSSKDIADAVAEALAVMPEQNTIRYTGSEKLPVTKRRAISERQLANPGWNGYRLTDKAMLQGLKMAKVPEKRAETLVEMQAAMHSGKPLKNFHRHQPKMATLNPRILPKSLPGYTSKNKYLAL